MQLASGSPFFPLQLQLFCVPQPLETALSRAVGCVLHESTAMKQLPSPRQVLGVLLLPVGLLGRAISSLLVGMGKGRNPQVMLRSQSFSQ